MDEEGIKESHFNASALNGLPAEAIQGRGIWDHKSLEGFFSNQCKGKVMKIDIQEIVKPL